MKNNLTIASRYAVLAGLLMLLWISLEYMVGLHDKFANFYPYVTPLSVCILVFCCHRAYREKLRDQAREISFRELFSIGFMLVVFAAVLVIAVQFIYHTLINPEFFKTMIDNAGHKALAMGEDPEIARNEFKRLFNLDMFMFLSSTATFVTGTLVALLLALRMNTSRD